MRILVLMMFLISFNSNSATCIGFKSNGTLKRLQQSVNTCSHLLLSKSEYDSFSDETLVSTFKELFEFSPTDFALINSIFLVAFISSHGVGRVVRLLGKT
jgi:hypothetical protein